MLAAKLTLPLSIWALLLCLVSGYAQTSEMGSVAPTHGTVNVIVGNRNGIVVATDSRLTDGNKRVVEDNAQKLFRIDTNTVCAIAGAYDLPGPTVAGGPGYVLEEVANVINILSEHGQSYWARKSFQNKVDSIASAVLFTLNFMTKIQRFVDLQPSIITVASNKAGHLEVVSVELKPITKEGIVDHYEKGEPYHLDVDTFRGWVVAQPQIALPFLMNPVDYPDQKVISEIPILARYKDSFTAKKRDSLTIAELTELATELEKLTARKVAVVGGNTQIAVLAPDNLIYKPSVPYRSVHMNHIVASLENFSSTDNARDGISTSGHQKSLVTNGKMSNGHQTIDDAFFFNYSFDNCILFYGGSTAFGLDGSNQIIDSTLILGSGVDPNSQIVRGIRTNFPSLKIISIGDYHSPDPYWPPDPYWSPR